MSDRTLQVGQVWEHWRSRNRVRIDSFGALVQCTGDDGRPYSIDPDDLMSSYLYVGTLAS